MGKVQTLAEMAEGAAPVAPEPLPVNLEAEQALLGAILVNNAALEKVIDFLQVDHFSEQFHQSIYSVSCMLFREKTVVTPITLKGFLGDFPLTPNGFSTSHYLARLAAEATTIVNAADYGRMIVEASIRREMIGIADNVTVHARTAVPGEPASSLLENAEAAFAQCRLKLAPAIPLPTVSGTIDDLIANAVEMREGRAPPIPSTGFKDLDAALGGGFRPSRLYVAAGRPGMGKTVFEVASARQVARQGFGNKLNNLEIDDAETAARLCANMMARSHHPLDYRDILTGNLNDAELEALRDVGARAAGLPIEIDTTAAMTISQIESRAKRTQDRMGKTGIPLSVVWIDYLGLVSATDRYRGRKVDEAGEIALGAKNPAKRLGVSVFLFSQLNRAVEGREDKRPIMSDLRDSGNIEEHADAVMLLYRPAYYDAQSPDVRNGDAEAVERAERRKNELEIIIGKNRLGPTRSVKLFVDVAKSYVGNLGW